MTAATWSWTHPLGTATKPNERLAIAVAVGAMGTLGFAVTSPILPDLATEFGVSRGSIGLVQAAVSVPGVLFSALIGYLADRFGRRRVVLTALVLFSLFGCAGFFARSFWGLVGVRFLQGVGTSGILGMGIVLIGDAFEGEARTRGYGHQHHWGHPRIDDGADRIQPTRGRRNVQSIPYLRDRVSAGRMGESDADRLTKWLFDLPHRHLASAVQKMRRDRTLIDYAGVLIATLSGVFVLHGLGLTVTPLFLDEEFQTPLRQRGLILAAFQVGTILVAVRIGAIIARFGPQRTLTFAFWMMATGAAFAGLAPNALAVAGGLAFAGLGFGLFVPQAQSYAATAAGDQFRGVTVLMWVTVVRTAQVIGPPTGSVISDRLGGRVMFLLAAAGMAILAASWRPVRQLWQARGRQAAISS